MDVVGESRLRHRLGRRFDLSTATRHPCRPIVPFNSSSIACFTRDGYCTALENVDGLKALTSLRSLTLTGCSKLPNVDGLKGLASLNNLDLSSCTVLQNVDGLKGLTSLRSITLNGCSKLQNVDGLKGLTTIQIVKLQNCRSLSKETCDAIRHALPNTRFSFSLPAQPSHK